jgi:hypothetical protein
MGFNMNMFYCLQFYVHLGPPESRKVNHGGQIVLWYKNQTQKESMSYDVQPTKRLGTYKKELGRYENVRLQQDM